MKYISIIAALIAVSAAVAIPAELQERQCLANGLPCDPANNKCCSNHCEAVNCGGNTYNCEPFDTGCSGHGGKKAPGHH